MNTSEHERLRRWRLILGESAQESCGLGLDDMDLAIDRALNGLDLVTDLGGTA